MLPLIPIAVATVEAVTYGLAGYALYKRFKKNKSNGMFNIGLWGRKGAGKTTLLRCLGARIPEGQTTRKIPFDNIDFSFEGKNRTISINVDNEKSHDVPGDKTFKNLLKIQEKDCLNLFIYVFDIRNYFDTEKTDSDNGKHCIQSDLNDLFKHQNDNSKILLLGTHVDEMPNDENQVYDSFQESLAEKIYKSVAKNFYVINLDKGEESKKELFGILNHYIFAEEKNEK